MPTGGAIREQGRRSNVSATPSSAASALKRSSALCHKFSLPFKHLASPTVLISANSKDADRSASGKFVTIYPTLRHDLRTVLDALDSELGGLPGPYILSDLRWNAGPVYIRFGSFVKRTIIVDGVEHLAIRHPEGHLVPDVRSAASMSRSGWSAGFRFSAARHVDLGSTARVLPSGHQGAAPFQCGRCLRGDG